MEISHFRLLAPNMKECFLFYRDVMGLEVKYGNEDTLFAEFQTGNINLALETPMVEEAIPPLQGFNTFRGNERVVIVFRVDDIDEKCHQLKSKGVHFVKEPYDEPEWNMRIAYLRDPAGNLIELNKGI